MADETQLLENLIRKLEKQDAGKWVESFYSNSHYSRSYSTGIEDLKIDVACEGVYCKDTLIWRGYRLYINDRCIFDGEKVEKLYTTISEKVKKYEQQKKEELELRKEGEHYKERQEIFNNLKKLS
ncbi:MAG: hypothetical protein Q8N63_05735 [Nanoarchaeota archaeon]|nr:hypothetical protein [Nanoarchaeota archaeon]